MPRIYWTPARKAELSKDAKLMTLKELEKKYRRKPSEIEEIINRMHTGFKPVIKEVYYEGKIRITVYTSPSSSDTQVLRGKDRLNGIMAS